MKPAGIRAVVFDAVGTLIHPDPPAAEVYAKVGRRYGSRLTLDEIRSRFTVAFGRQEEMDRQSGWRTSEQREVERWRSIVSQVLDDTRDGENCFRDLFEHFSRPEAWRCEPETAEVLKEVTARGFATGIASNFDRRLRTVLAGLGETVGRQSLIVSSEVGWRKPSREFFAALCNGLELAPGEILYVGDDPMNDYEGARAGGLTPVLVERGRLDFRRRFEAALNRS